MSFPAVWRERERVPYHGMREEGRDSGANVCISGRCFFLTHFEFCDNPWQVVRQVKKLEEEVVSLRAERDRLESRSHGAEMSSQRVAR